MADKHPYISGAGALAKAIQHFRKSLPGKIDASTLKKLGIAPKNESYLINILKFLKLIEEDGSPTAVAKKALTQHDDKAFGKDLEALVRAAYEDIFSLHGDNAWKLDENALITYFRQTDQTSAVVGSRQAKTFQTLAAFCGHGDVPERRESAPRNGKEPTAKKKTTPPKAESPKVTIPVKPEAATRDFGLTVRVEINLPADGNQETYDRIFKSIKANLLDG